MNTTQTKGLLHFTSPHQNATTATLLEITLQSHGMKVLARVNHAKAAAGAGLELRPTELLIFGNPAAGTPLMQKRQTAAIDLPQKALVWQDEEGVVRITFNDPQYLVERHGIEDDTVAARMKDSFEAIATEVTAARPTGPADQTSVTV